jgi:hypothetical protein
MFDDYMFTKPSFLRGVARAVDIGGSLSRDAFVLSQNGTQADRRALDSDWRAVNRDVNEAMQSAANGAEQEA